MVVAVPARDGAEQAGHPGPGRSRRIVDECGQQPYTRRGRARSTERR